MKLELVECAHIICMPFTRFLLYCEVVAVLAALCEGGKWSTEC